MTKPPRLAQGSPWTRQAARVSAPGHWLRSSSLNLDAMKYFRSISHPCDFCPWKRSYLNWQFDFVLFCLNFHDIRLRNNVIQNRQYWSTFNLHWYNLCAITTTVTMNCATKVSLKDFWPLRFKMFQTSRNAPTSGFSAAGLAHELQFRWVIGRMR